MMNKFRLVPKGISVYEVFLDDIDISKYVSAIDFSIKAGGVANVKLTILAEVDIPENIKAQLPQLAQLQELNKE